jgi:GNAT superfamily N-acetyltransferase
VTSRFRGTERLDPARHNPDGFQSGNETLDRWLLRYAGQSDRRDAARTFVSTDEAGIVLAYYTLVAGELEHAGSTELVRKGMSPHYPIPVAILARLAVDRRHQGQGFGARMLNDALSRVTLAAEQIAVRAVVVHAIDDNTTAFYEHFGFKALTATPQTRMVTLAELRAAGYSATTQPNR